MRVSSRKFISHYRGYAPIKQEQKRFLIISSNFWCPVSIDTNCLLNRDIKYNFPAFVVAMLQFLSSFNLIITAYSHFILIFFIFLILTVSKLFNSVLVLIHKLNEIFHFIHFIFNISHTRR